MDKGEEKYVNIYIYREGQNEYDLRIWPNGRELFMINCHAIITYPQIKYKKYYDILKKYSMSEQ